MKSNHLLIAALGLATGFTAAPQEQPSPDANAAQAIAPPVSSSNMRLPQTSTGGMGGGGMALPQPPRQPGTPPPAPRTAAGVNVGPDNRYGPDGRYGGGYGSSGGGGYGGSGSAGASISQGTGFSQRLQSIVNRAESEPGNPGEPLMILSSETDPGVQARLNEDLTVMAHILQKASGSAGPGVPGRAMGVDLLFTPGGEAQRNLYLQGFGAVFLLKVPFPLLAAPGKGDRSKEEVPADSEWERAKRELRGQPQDAFVPGPMPEPYHEDRVAQLKNAIIEALKNANNIRELKPDESVVVCLIGPGVNGVAPRAEGHSWGALRGQNSANPALGDLPLIGSMNVRERRPYETMLTIRVRKSDIEAFAKDKTDAEGFRSKVKIVAYGT